MWSTWQVCSLISLTLQLRLRFLSVVAMAQAANFYKLVRPRMVDENVIKIKGGRWVDPAAMFWLIDVLKPYRHILQELTVASYVPNDTFIEGKCIDEITSEVEGLAQGSESRHGTSMLLLTGPNYSGKSVYMKQVSDSGYCSVLFIDEDRLLW